MTAEARATDDQRHKTKLRRRITKAIGAFLLAIAKVVVPYVYIAYMWFVFKTSRVERYGFHPDVCRKYFGEGVFGLWHDEVFFVAWMHRIWRGSTLASRGDSGEVIARMLKLCNFTVFRGGSSSGHKRRNVGVVGEIIEHIQETPGTQFGITVDGSKGPVYRMKRGVPLIARATGKPALVQRSWCKRYVCLPTWDKTLVPLPFNHIVSFYEGPFLPPSEDEGEEAFEAFHKSLERHLCLLAAYLRRITEGPDFPEEWLAKFPEDVRDEMRKALPPETLFHDFEGFDPKDREAGDYPADMPRDPLPVKGAGASPA